MHSIFWINFEKQKTLWHDAYQRSAETQSFPSRYVTIIIVQKQLQKRENKLDSDTQISAEIVENNVSFFIKPTVRVGSNPATSNAIFMASMDSFKSTGNSYSWLDWNRFGLRVSKRIILSKQSSNSSLCRAFWVWRRI